MSKETASQLGRGRPKDLEKRDAIREAARTLFFQLGFEGVSIDAIAEAAGVAKVTVYSHFGDKESLFGEVVASVCESMHLPRPPAFAGAADFRNQLVIFGTALVSKLSSTDMIAMDRLLSSQAARNPKMAAAFYQAGPGAVHALLTELVAKGEATGLIAVDNHADAAERLLGMWLGLQKLRQQLGLLRERTEAEIQSHVRKCVDVFLKGNAPQEVQGAD